MVWFDDLPLKSVDSYDDLKKAFLENFLQQKKCIKDLVEIHHIKQREGEFIEDFVQRFKTKSRHVKGALKCMRISGFKHGITNPELIKRLHDKILKSVDEMMRVTTMFLTGEVTASNEAWKKTLPARKLSHVIKELTQGSGKDQPKIVKKGEVSGKDKAMAILMVQPWQRVARLWPEVKSQMVPATAPLNGFSRKIIWPMGQILLLVKIGDAELSTSTWMNFVIVRMLTFPVLGGIHTLRSSKNISLECTVVSGPEAQPADVTQPAEERIKVAIPLEYPKQTIAIGSTLTEEGGSMTLSGASTEHSRRMPSSQTKEKKRSTREEQGNSRGSRKTCRCQHHKGSPLPQLVIKSDNGKKARQQLEDVCGLQRPK
ncbi:reverse transcriptase domain-containing protein [Tanacetum coccineum]